MKDFYKDKKNIVLGVIVIIVLVIMVCCLRACNSDDSYKQVGGSNNEKTTKAETVTVEDKIGQDKTEPLKTEKTTESKSEAETIKQDISKGEQESSKAVVVPSEPAVETPTKPVEQPTEAVNEPESEPESRPAEPENPTPQHVHTWEFKVEKVHHEAVKHTEQVYVVDQAAYDEEIKERVTVCNQCGAVFNNDYAAYDKHVMESNGACGSYHTEKRVVDVIHHEEVGHYEEKEIIDKEAYDEVIAVWYECISCGEKR